MLPVSVDVLAGGVLASEDGALELGGVRGLIAEPEFGGVAGAIDDELEEPDGEGATTGGVLDVVLGVSRWQPATPSTSPVHSNVISVLLIVISRSG